MKTLMIAMTAIFALTAATAEAKPIDCHASKARWVQRLANKWVASGGQVGLDPSQSIPALNLYLVTWDDSSREYVRIGTVEGQVCVVERNKVR